MKKNDIIKLKITGMTHDGSGVGRYDGMAAFVQNTAIGDEIEALVMKVKKTYAFAKVQKIITPSKDRIDPECKVFLSCGGCRYQHITYESELKIKEQKVKDSIERVGKISAPVNPIIPSDDIFRYRNKGQYPVSKNKDGKTVFGFFAPHSHRVIACDDCLLAPEDFKDILSKIGNFADENNISVYDESTNLGLLRHICLRKPHNSGEIMVMLVINGDKIPNEEKLTDILSENKSVKSIVININKSDTNVILGDKNRVIFGDGYITDTLCGLKFRISPNSFYQVNGKQTEKLYNKAREYANLKKDDVLLDLYCGVGTIGLTMAKDCKELYGVEIVDEAVQNAKENARINNIDNAHFYAGDATLLANKLKEKKINPNVVIVDPPRKGLSPELIETITADFKPDRVVYVSCDPATLARDSEIFEGKGYLVKQITPVDMFPRTVHVETVVLMSRVENQP
jgi:23S rRNA (uracil1939-C5)-methyltransferase